MLDMGFREDIETILNGVPEERQAMLFSATMPKPIMELAEHTSRIRDYQSDQKGTDRSPNITRYYYKSVKEQKRRSIIKTSYLRSKAVCSIL